jgi:solute carrier family 25 phosphate transporter 23/24/25/41
VRDGLRQRGIAISSKQLTATFKGMDSNADQRISLAEFDRFCESRRSQLKHVFKSIDGDGDGCVTSEELRCGVERAGLKISDDQLRWGCTS